MAFLLLRRRLNLRRPRSLPLRHPRLVAFADRSLLAASLELPLRLLRPVPSDLLRGMPVVYLESCDQPAVHREEAAEGDLRSERLVAVECHLAARATAARAFQNIHFAG